MIGRGGDGREPIVSGELSVLVGDKLRSIVGYAFVWNAVSGEISLDGS